MTFRPRKARNSLQKRYRSLGLLLSYRCGEGHCPKLAQPPSRHGATLRVALWSLSGRMWPSSCRGKSRPCHGEFFMRVRLSSVLPFAVFERNGPLTAPALAQAPARAGFLHCAVAPGAGMVVTSSRALDCTFAPNVGGPVEHYVGNSDPRRPRSRRDRPRRHRLGRSRPDRDCRTWRPFGQLRRSGRERHAWDWRRRCSADRRQRADDEPSAAFSAWPKRDECRGRHRGHPPRLRRGGSSWRVLSSSPGTSRLSAALRALSPCRPSPSATRINAHRGCGGSRRERRAAGLTRQRSHARGRTARQPPRAGAPQ